MTKFEVYTNNPTEIVEDYEEACFKTKEQHMADYIKSMKALEDAMEPYKEQKRELKADYIDKNDVDIDALIDIYDNLRKEKTT